MSFLHNFRPIFDDGERLWGFCAHHKDVYRPNLSLAYTGKYMGKFKCWACGYQGRITLESLVQILKDFGKDYRQDMSTIKKSYHNSSNINWLDVFSEIPVIDITEKQICTMLGFKESLADNPGDYLGCLGAIFNGHCIIFPMYDENLHITGLHLRPHKTNLRGSKIGVFMDPRSIATFSGSEVFICEGVTDLICLLYMGFKAIGRFSASLSSDIIVKLVTKCKIPKVVIIPDNDTIGIKSAQKLAEKLKIVLIHLTYRQSCDILYLDERYKDIKDFCNQRGFAYVKEKIEQAKNLTKAKN